MPELAEVEFYRKRWGFAATGARVVRVHAGTSRPLRDVNATALRAALQGTSLGPSAAAAKRMMFRFSSGAWLGIHLGMSGELLVLPPDHAPERHDHLVITTDRHALVYRDPRMFGRIDFAPGPETPSWWSDLPPPILSPSFTATVVATFLQRRSRTPIKAALLMQERFPGVGNWMADEILWRAGIHPARLSGSLNTREAARIWRECRHVCRQALDVIAGRGRRPPPDLDAPVPRTWLFPHRWRAGGRCPRTGVPLLRATIGGRTTCWSPARQRLA